MGSVSRLEPSEVKSSLGHISKTKLLNNLDLKFSYSRQRNARACYKISIWIVNKISISSVSSNPPWVQCWPPTWHAVRVVIILSLNTEGGSKTQQLWRHTNHPSVHLLSIMRPVWLDPVKRTSVPMAEPHWTETEWIQTSTYGHLDVDFNQYRYKWLQQLVNEELYELYNDIYPANFDLILHKSWY